MEASVDRGSVEWSGVEWLSACKELWEWECPALQRASPAAAVSCPLCALQLVPACTVLHLCVCALSSVDVSGEHGHGAGSVGAAALSSLLA